MNWLQASEEEKLLPKNLVMIDCEMTGVVPDRDHLLQVAMLKLKLEGSRYEVYDEPLVLYFPCEGQPSNDFQKKYLAEIFEKCNESTLTDEDAKSQIVEWLGELKGTVIPVGDCVPTDMTFLYARGIIDRPDIKDDKPVPGTFDFRFFELCPLKLVARQKLGKEFDTPGVDTEGIHDALVDCENQVKDLNEYLRILLGEA